MSFHDVAFPLDIALQSEGGPVRRTEIVTLNSGHEQRNARWAGSRRRFNAGYGVKSINDLEAVIAFFEARRGRLHAFRFRDPFDHQSSLTGSPVTGNDQVIGIGDGTATSYGLVKNYDSGGAVYQRVISKPIIGTEIIMIDGALQIPITDYSLDPLTGMVVFSAPPAAGVTITAGYVFDVPVRFDTDQLEISLAAFQAGDIPSIPLLEVLD